MKRRDFFKLGAGAGIIALSGKADALEFYPMPSDKKWAVLFGTWCGTARDAGVWISEGMGGIAEVFDVREKPDLKRFDHLVVGGAIRANAMPEELQDFIKKNQKIIQERVRGYFAVCGNRGQPPEREQTVQFIDKNLAQLCGVKDLPSRVFLGRITKSLMEPQVAERMASFEDYDNLKRYECMKFGSEVLGSV